MRKMRQALALLLNASNIRTVKNASNICTVKTTHGKHLHCKNASSIHTVQSVSNIHTVKTTCCTL
jgi:hypothetical protein